MRTDKEIIEKGQIWRTMPLGGVGMGGLIKLPDCRTCTVVWTHGNGIEPDHVSIAPVKKFNIPSWEDMATLKDIFFGDEEEVYQIHPRKSEYVNVKENCLHLWKPARGKIVMDAFAEIEKLECSQDSKEFRNGWNEAMKSVNEIINRARDKAGKRGEQ